MGTIIENSLIQDTCRVVEWERLGWDVLSSVDCKCHGKTENYYNYRHQIFPP